MFICMKLNSPTDLTDFTDTPIPCCSEAYNKICVNPCYLWENIFHTDLTDLTDTSIQRYSEAYFKSSIIDLITFIFMVEASDLS